MLSYLAEIFAFIFGICIGSFLNVCIYRLPAAKSIIHPRSMCFNCGNTIRFYDNIPILSYLWLSAKCRHCGAPISIRYLLVESMTGLFAVCVYLKFGFTLEAVIYFVFIATLLVITFIDIDHRIIPDIISIPGIPIFFLASLSIQPYLDSLLGILSGGGILYLVALAYSLLTKKEGMGGGDIKLLAMIGALIGWKGVLFTIFVSSAAGTLSGLVIMILTRQGMKLAVPFGPFLAVGAIAYIFVGPQLMEFYLQLFA
ncbi:MAG: prepilin peptidase [Desulfobacterales bacterium]